MVWRLAGSTILCAKMIITIMRVIVFIYQFLISLIMNPANIGVKLYISITPHPSGVKPVC